ncbi:MAG: tRNA pseudouridine(38-40) synthase TruA [Candidatus Methanoperedens sp.]|nr:tRNA pseudouridine(38-40) synthase TruA [Candidatus Methanoperedens sp.]
MDRKPGEIKVRIALKFAYLGNDYYGYQIQPGVPTIEGKLLKALKDCGALKNTPKARYAASGRTDRGVHALGQVIAFDTDNAEAAKPGTINSALAQIWVYAWACVDANFNARTSAVEREYLYIFWGKGLDIEKMKDSASIFPGRHDFRNFADEDKEKATLCDIKRISIHNEGDWFYLEITATRFLQHMVRKIAAALKLAGKGEIDREKLSKILDCSINYNLQPLGANGLILKDVVYPDIKWNIDGYARTRAVEEIHELFISHGTAARVLDEIERGMIPLNS